MNLITSYNHSLPVNYKHLLMHCRGQNNFEVCVVNMSEFVWSFEILSGHVKARCANDNHSLCYLNKFHPLFWLTG